jgi:predicted esterase
MRGAEVPPAPTSPEREILLTKDLDRVPRLPHLGSLSVPGYPDAVLAEPFDAGDAPRPVVVVIHGLGDLPEPHCEAWRNITGARAFVVCPRGGYDPQFSTWGNPRYTHPCCEALRAHIDASLASLSARFGALADTRHPLLAGFSLGATEAALLAQSDTERFPRVAVLEGGLDVWFGATIRAFAARGGRRVLFGCGSAWCTPSARGAAGRIDGAGIGARVVFADVGHRPSPPLQAAIDDVFDWFVEGDSRWARD